MLCYLLECILVPDNTPTDCPKEWYELYFTFACIWSFGAAIYQEQVKTITKIYLEKNKKTYDNIFISNI